MMHRIDQLSAQQMQRSAVVEPDVVKRVRDDLRQPDQSGLRIPDEYEMDGPEQQAAQPHHQPDLRDVIHEYPRTSVRLEEAEQRRVRQQNQR
jgi:hypothetical protein